MGDINMKDLEGTGSTRKGKVPLNAQAREIIIRMYTFMKTEAEAFGHILPHLKNVRERVSDAANVSTTTISRILREGRNGVIASPKKTRTRKKPKADVDEDCKNAIRSIIRNTINEKQPNSIRLLHKKIVESNIGFSGSMTTLCKIIKSLGFHWVTLENNKKMLVEKKQNPQKKRQKKEKTKPMMQMNEQPMCSVPNPVPASNGLCLITNDQRVNHVSHINMVRPQGSHVLLLKPDQPMPPPLTHHMPGQSVFQPTHPTVGLGFTAYEKKKDQKNETNLINLKVKKEKSMAQAAVEGLWSW